jgi:hypothetical protein
MSPAIGFDPCPIYGKAPFSACEDCQSRCHPLPVLMAMVEQREVVPGDYSTTEILRPLQAMYLSRHNDFYIAPSKYIYMLNGTAVHSVIEEGGKKIVNQDKHQMEQAFREEILPGMFLTGRPDYYDDAGTLWDFKNSKAYTVKKIKSASMNKVSWASEDYFAQLNIYRTYKYPEAKKLKLYFLVQGWTKMETGISPVEIVDVPLAPMADVKLWVKNRMAKIWEIEKTGECPRCLLGDLWIRKDGVPVRCQEYCNASEKCTQFQEWKDGKK